MHEQQTSSCLARLLSYKGFPYYHFIQCRKGPSFAAAQLSIESGNSRANASSISNSELLITAKRHACVSVLTSAVTIVICSLVPYSIGCVIRNIRAKNGNAILLSC